MKIVSYNVNGLRAALGHGLLEWIQDEQPDIVCLQETKLSPEQLNRAELEHLGYQVYLYPAQRKGYSGVGILTKHPPVRVVYGMDIPKYDEEGRMLRLDFEEFSIVSVYHPSGSSGEERIAFKLQWLDDWQKYIQELRQVCPRLVLCGDFNICHRAIDIHDPVRGAKLSGFLPEERAWMEQFLSLGYVDAWRTLNPDVVAYSWWSYRAKARERNKGWRIDYCLLTEELLPMLTQAALYTDAYHSDHCPVGIKLNLDRN